MKTKIIFLLFFACILFSCSKKDNDDNKKPERALWEVVIEQDGNYQMFDRMFSLSGADMGLNDVEVSLEYSGTKYESILWSSSLLDNFPEGQNLEINVTNPVSGIAVQYTISDTAPEFMSATISIYCNGELYAKATNALTPNITRKNLAFACNYGQKPNIIFTLTDGGFNIWMEDVDGNPIPME